MDHKESATILIVDDDPVTLTIVAEQISLYDYQPVVASTAEEAFRVAEKHAKIDLLLTDIIMPEMNGFELARQFASLYPGTRILFMSGNNIPSVAGHKIPVDGSAFVQKPFEMDTLISKIKNILSGPLEQQEGPPGP